MRIAVLGTGMVGRALAGGLGELGHEVVVGTRDPATTSERAEYAEWLAAHPGVGLATLADAAEGSDVVVNAGSGSAALELLQAAGIDRLPGVIVLDVANPLDFDAGFPPTLTVKDTDSLGEQVQRAFPEARVVKTLNTMNADLMVDPGQLPEPTTVFVCGDDAEAKQVATDLLHDLGHQDVLDLGGIESARGVEMWLPLWLRIMGALGTAKFNVRVVRG